MSSRRVLLLSAVALLLLYNLWRFNHNRGTRPAVPSGVVASAVTPDLWSAFDKAAALRDADDPQFRAALDNLAAARNAMPSPNLKSNAEILADIRGCTTWLNFYRQNHDPAWRARTLQHIQSCSQNHADIAR